MPSKNIQNTANFGILAGLCLFAGALCLSVSLTEIGLGIALLCVIIAWIAKLAKKQARLSDMFLFLRTPLILAWGLYLIAGLLCCFFGINPARSFSHWDSDIVKAASFIFLIHAVSAQRADKMAAFYLSGAVVSAIIVIGQTLYIFFESSAIIRGHGTMHAVFYGNVISLALGLSMAKFIFSKWNKKALLTLIPVAILASALALNKTRGAYLCTAITLMCFFLFYAPGRKKAALLAVLTLGFLLFFFNFQSQTRLSRRAIVSSTQVRLEMWDAGVRIFRDFPLFGVGIANVRTVFDFYHPEPIKGKRGWGSVHNLYIQQAAERGLIGLGVLFLLLFSMIRFAWKMFRQNPNPYTLWCLGTLPGFLAMNLTETAFQHAVPALSVCFIIAAAFSQSSKSPEVRVALSSAS